jgi:hypothetical protein
MSCLLSIGSQGNARTVTLKAFTYEDASNIMENIQQQSKTFILDLFLYQNTDCFKIALFVLRILKNNYSQRTLRCRN